MFRGDLSADQVRFTNGPRGRSIIMLGLKKNSSPLVGEDGGEEGPNCPGSPPPSPSPIGGGGDFRSSQVDLGFQTPRLQGEDSSVGIFFKSLLLAWLSAYAEDEVTGSIPERLTR